jgi:hypothetical protein
MVTEEHPKLFVSYSWSNKEHEQWVISLATQLRESGVNVVLDKWELKEGNDSIAFMEKMVTDPEIKKVMMVCDRLYSEKADGRSGGVGTETQIISPKIYAQSDQNKFVAVLSEKDENGKPYLPTYYQSRIYVDLSDEEVYATNFDQLIRWVYDKPLYIKPEIGRKPSFLFEENPISLGTTAKYRRAIDAVKNNKDYVKGAMQDYLDTFVTNLEKFRITDTTGEFDEKVIENIEKFLPYRNELIEVFNAISQNGNQETTTQIHRFFEHTIPYLEKPDGLKNWKNWDFDNFKFIVHEIYLYFIAILLKNERFDTISRFLHQEYYVPENVNNGKNAMVSFDVFSEYLTSLEFRNKRLNLRRLSLHADLLEQRSKTIGIPFSQIMQADFILFVVDAFRSLKEESYQRWSPVTLLYTFQHRGPFEIFARAQSKDYFNKIKVLFEIRDKTELDSVIEAFKSEKLRVLRWDLQSFNPKILINYEKLATKP